MSTCWKCERPVAEGQTECDPFCQHAAPEQLAATPSLNQELQAGDNAAQALAAHLYRMRADKLQREIGYNGQRYEITVKRL